MILRNKKFIIGVLVLVAFVGIGVFGLLPVSHANHIGETPMVNCPYNSGSYSLCDNSFTHINNWKQFSNFIIPSLLVLFLTFALVWYFTKNFFVQEKYFYRYKYYLNNKDFFSYREAIINWLSLFENSPGDITVRHS